jgi:hypothetical protein
MDAEILGYVASGVELWKIAKVCGVTVAYIEDLIAAQAGSMGE